MTLEEAMQKANEGGYHIYGSDGMDTSYEGANSAYSVWTRKDNESSFIVLTEKTFLDPQFWQALGRALGWSEVCDLSITCVHGEEECRQCHGYYWMYQWHCFIQAIADGNIPEAFFAHLPFSQSRSNRKTHRHQAGLNDSRDRAPQRVHAIQEILQHIDESARQVRTRAELTRQITQATRAQCQRIRHRRARMRQVLHG